MKDVIYLAYKEPINQHPQKCRIGVCDETPIINEGWCLFSSMKGVFADEIYLTILKYLDEVKNTNYDSANDAWMIPVNVLNRWMTSIAERLHRRNPQTPSMQYFSSLAVERKSVFVLKAINPVGHPELEGKYDQDLETGDIEAESVQLKG